MKYYEVKFKIEAPAGLKEAAGDVVSALAGEAGFETFEPVADGVVGYVQQSLYDAELLQAQLACLPLPGCTVTFSVSEAADEDWNAQWEQQGFDPIVIPFPATRGGELIVHDGRHLPPTPSPADVMIEIDARLAFGTGTHETTLLVIELLEMIPGMDLTVLDQECCGMAGTFGFKKENYGYSMAIGGKLFDHIRQAAAGTAMAVRPAPPEDYPFGKGFAARKPSSDAFASAAAGSGSAPSLAEGSSLRGKLGQGPAFANSAAAAGAVVITDCETCKWQIEAGTGLPVFNPISILVQALDLEATASLNAQA